MDEDPLAMFFAAGPCAGLQPDDGDIWSQMFLPAEREEGFAVLNTIRKHCFAKLYQELTPVELNDLDLSSLMNGDLFDVFGMGTLFTGTNIGTEVLEDGLLFGVTVVSS